MEASHLQILFGPNATTHDGGHFVLVMCSLSLGGRECYRRLDAVGPGEPAVVNVANARTTAYGAPMPENRHPISSVIVADKPGMTRFMEARSFVGTNPKKSRAEANGVYCLEDQRQDGISA